MKIKYNTESQEEAGTKSAAYSQYESLIQAEITLKID